MDAVTYLRKKLSLQFVWFYILFILLLCRISVLFFFSFKYIDQDQLILWMAAVEISEGIFREPCFWGQNYNSTLESFFAAPLIKLWNSPEYSLPVVTALLAIFPYIYISFLAKKRNESLLSLIALIIPIVMTVEYDIITSMPRGWVTGIFVASIGLYSCFFPLSKWGWVTFGLVTVLGLWLNPNCGFITVFTGWVLLKYNYKKPAFYLLMSMGAAIPFYGWYRALHFYEINPGYNLHGSPSLDFSIRLLVGHFNNLDNFFRHISPVHQVFGWIFFLGTLSLIIIMYIKGKKNEAVIYLVLFICFLLTLGIEKTNDGHTALFLSGARFYLAFPILLVFIINDFLSCFRLNLQRVLSIIAVIAFAGFANKLIRLEQRYPDLKSVGKKHWVSVDEVTNIRDNCDRLHHFSRQYKVSLIVFEETADQLLNYGCPCFQNDFPLTIFPWYERRTWRLMEETNRIHSNIMFFNPKHEMVSFATFENPAENIFILRNNNSATIDLLKSYKYEIRKY